MTLLTLVRHGETDWNRDRRIQGSTDIPLNDTGRAQAREAAAALRADIDANAPIVVAASDLSRARETAEIIAAELGVDGPRIYPELRERGYGEAEGLGVDEFAERWGDWHAAQVPGAETTEDVLARALTGLRQAVGDARRETAPGAASLIIVSHGALIRSVIGHASSGEYPLRGEKLPNGSRHRMLFERDRIRLLSYVGAAV